MTDTKRARLPRHGTACPETNETRHTGRDHHNRLPKLADICADDGEVLALSVARFVAAGYMTADVACWDAAYDAAERVLDPFKGPRFVAAVTALMRSIRAERQEDWRFMPATCCRATDDECLLVSLLNAARQPLNPEVQVQAAKLSRTSEAPRIARAAEDLAEMLDEFHAQLAPCKTASLH